MKTVRLIIQVSKPTKHKLDQLRKRGYSISGFIRSLLEQHFNQAPAKAQKGRNL